MNEDTNISTPPQPPLVIPDVSRCPSINFFNVDCIEFMRSKPDKCYDLAIVDPPYGLPKGSTRGAGKLRNRILNKGNIRTWDKVPPQEYFDELWCR